MSFLFDGTNQLPGSVPDHAGDLRVLQVRHAGKVSATYNRTAIPNAATIATDYATEVSNRIPTKAISALATDYPSSGVDVSKFGPASPPQT